MKRWSWLLGLMLVGMPTMAIAQEKEQEDMDHEEMAHEDHAAMDTEARAAIEAAVEQWEAAFNAGDAEASASFFLDDGVSMPPGSAALEGKAAIVAYMAAGFEQSPGMQIEFRTDEVMAKDGHAIEVGGYNLSGADGAHLDHGKYIAIWVRTDDGWKVARDIWNSDMAPPQQ